MKLSTLVLAAVLFASSHVFAEEPRTAPDWTLQSSAGDDITLSEVASEKPTVLLFWATWCPYCKALMPHIQSISHELGDEIEVLAVHFRDDKGDAVAFIEAAGYTFTLLPNGDDVARLNGAWGTPAVLLIDKDRKVRFDLYDVQRPDSLGISKDLTHSDRGNRLAPYWASELRKSLDALLVGNSSNP